MKRTHRSSVWMMASLTTFSIVLAIPWIWWQSEASTPLEVLIIDKGASESPNPEHKGLIWLLNQQKIVRKNGERYMYDENDADRATTYSPSVSRRLPEDIMTDTDIIYVTSSLNRQGSTGLNESSAREGITEQDIGKIREAASRGVLVVAEYGTLSNTLSPAAQKQFYELMHVRSSGWRGKYISHLQSSDEVPEQVMKRYEAETRAKWPYSGSGLLLMHEDGSIVVLCHGTDMRTEDSGLAFTQEGTNWTGIDERIHYDNWFDIVEPDSKDAVKAWFRTGLTDAGRQKLQDARIPLEFPAVIRHDDNVRTYYMAGSFDELNNYSFWRRIKGWDVIRNWLTPNRKGVPDVMYWKAYVPMMKTILREAERAVGSQP